jgi:hypothetical protein
MICYVSLSLFKARESQVKLWLCLHFSWFKQLILPQHGALLCASLLMAPGAVCALRMHGGKKTLREGVKDRSA